MRAGRSSVAFRSGPHRRGMAASSVLGSVPVDNDVRT